MNVLNGASTLIKDAETKTLDSGKTVVNYSVVQPSPQDATTSVFWNISVWPGTEKQIEFFGGLTKGSVVSFTDMSVNNVYSKEEDGKKTINISVNARNISVIKSASAGAEGSRESTSKGSGPVTATRPRAKVSFDED